MMFTFLFLNLAKIPIFIPKSALGRGSAGLGIIPKKTVFFYCFPNDDNGDDAHDVKPWNASQSVAPRPLKPRSPAQPPPRTASNDHRDHHSDH